MVSPRMLRDSSSERSLTYQYDPELGWAPVPNSSAVITNARTIHAQHNSLGLRDIEFVQRQPAGDAVHRRFLCLGAR